VDFSLIKLVNTTLAASQRQKRIVLTISLIDYLTTATGVYLVRRIKYLLIFLNILNLRSI